MKKSVSYVVAVVLLLSVLLAGPQLGPYGVDAVSAATGGTTTPAPAPKPTPKPAPKPAAKPAAKPAPATTKAPVATQAATKISRLLVDGSFGSEVKLLQTMLNNNGYTLKVDGFFGKKTLAAVKSYQGKNGLVADGMVGPKTLAKLAPATPATPATPAKPATPAAPAKPATPAAPAKPAADTVTSASIVNEAAAFEKAISKDGTWIIAILKDLTVNKDLVLEGEFHDKNDPAKDFKRKIALYSQDDKHNVTARFTLTAPKLIVKSPKATLQHGIFVGDIYVEANNFSLVDNKVTGNIYFANQAAKDTFVIDDKSSVSGKQAVAGVDVVTSASLVQDTAAFEKAISKDGKWIIAALNNLTFSKELVLDGDFVNTKTPPVSSRKIALYTQDDKHNLLSRFTLTAPKLTIKSPDANISKGTFKGDLYVSAKNFKLVDAIVDGNVYFANQEAKDTFTIDTTSSITGKQAVAGVDVVTSASLVQDTAAFEKAISKDGTWIIPILNNLTFNKELVVAGEFHDKNDPAKDLKRKIALYTQDDKHNLLSRFTLTAPKLTIESPNANISKGTFKGDVYVSAKNFSLIDAKVDGNVYFTTQEAKDTFTMDATSSVTGVQELKTK